jgi:hypothetical protein
MKTKRISQIPGERSKRFTAATALVVATCLVSFAAAASVIAPPPATYSGTDIPSGSGPGTYHVSTLGAGNSATVTFTAAPAPSITLNVTAGNKDVPGAFSSDTLTYYYSISGPDTADHRIDVQIATTMQIATSGSVVTLAFATLSGSDIADTQVACLNIPDCVYEGGYGLALTLTEHISFHGWFALTVLLDVYSGSASAFVDPVLTLPEGYTIVLSDGIGNGATARAVSEPGSLGLLVLGLLGFAGSRRKSS